MFDQRSNTYDESPMHRWLAERSVANLAVQPRSTVLDVAAGTGLATRALIADHPGLRCIAVDLSAGLLKTARRSGLYAVRGDAERLPIQDAVVDWVICVSAAAYFPHPELALSEFARVVRPGGGVVVQAWAADGLAPTRALRAAAADHGVAIADPNAALGRIELLAAALADAGLSHITVTVATWRQTWASPDDAWSAAAAGFGDALPDDLEPAIRRRFEELWAAARAKSPEYDDQRALIATATKAPDGAPVVPRTPDANRYHPWSAR
jgi:SAM-dependent methyltransferase